MKVSERKTPRAAGLMAAREKISFEIDLDKVPVECQGLVKTLKEVAEERLFRWRDSFDVTPPTSYFNQDASQLIPFGNIFMVPDFDESSELALDSMSGEPIRLNSNQLSSVRRNGEFEVDSRRFSGQRHRWRLNRFLQKGTGNTAASLQKDAVRGLQLLFVTARNRWCARGFSIRQALKGFVKGFAILCDLLIGLPHTNNGDLRIVLERELHHFLICELGVRGVSRGQLEEYWNFLEAVVAMNPEERSRYTNNALRDMAFVQPPYQFVTPGKVSIDLRLHSIRLMDLLVPILDDLIARGLDGWFFDFRGNLVAELRNAGQSLSDIAETVNRTCEKEFYRRVFALVENCADLNEIEPNIGETLVRQAKFALICDEADSVWEERLGSELEGIETAFRRRSPILSQMKPCMRSHIEAARAKFETENRYTKCEFALQQCVAKGLEAHAYFLSRLLQFWRERLPLLEKQVRATRQTFPDDVFTFRRHIWFPKNWIVRQSLYGNITEVETEVLDEPIDSTFNGEQEVYGRDRRIRQMSFTIYKYHEYRSSTRYPFWRWKNFFLRHYVLMMNVMGLLLIKFPCTSRFGARALFAKEPFYGGYTHSAWTKYIYPDRTKRVLTFVSRLSALWRHVRSSRHAFETSPNTGLMDKNVTRHFNRFWNYVLKGACGSALLCVLFPPASLLLTVMSVLLGATAVLWTPVLSLLYSVGFVMFVYDSEKPSVRRNPISPILEALFFHWLVRGVMQLVLAFLTSVIFCPLLAFFALVAGAFRFVIRSFWDLVIFHVVIKRHARIPAKEDWVARRIAGPGLASNHFYQARPEQILAALLAALEREQIDLWYANKRLEIAEPMENFQAFFKQTFAAFSMDTNSSSGVLKNLREQKDRLYQNLADEKTSRTRSLRLDVSMAVRIKIKLSLADLDTVTRSGTKLVESFYSSKLLPLLEEERSATETSWWTNMSMPVGDFDGLFNRLLGEEFGEQIFTPLEDTDTFYTLKIEHLDLGRYVEMLTEARPRDDLDAATGVLKEPMRLQNRLSRPVMVSSIFQPQIARLPAALRSFPDSPRRKNFRRVRLRAIKKKFSNAGSDPTRPGCLTALGGAVISVSCRIYHPAVIGALLHKRDRSDHARIANPLPLYDAFLREVLNKTTETSAVRSASLASVNPDLVQSATSGSPNRGCVVASEASLSMATTEDEEETRDRYQGYESVNLEPSDSQSTLEGE